MSTGEFAVPAEPTAQSIVRPHQFRILAAGFVGNVLEWFDFAVYGFFASIIGTLFFPASSPGVSLIASFGAFAAGFLMRPVGAILFGYIGDLVGRKTVLTLSVMLMAIPTFLVGCLPTHAQIGWLAAALMVVLRMVQGISVGGEYTGSIVFLVENSPDHRRGLSGSFSLLGATSGILLGSAVGALITGVLSEEQLYSWGWRLPFWSGILIAFVGLVLRKGIPETEVKEEAKAKAPLVDAVKFHWRGLLQAVGLNVMGAVAFYTIFIYMATWIIQQEPTITSVEALEINTVSMFVLTLTAPLAAFLSDRLGRKPFLIAGSVGLAFGAYPLLWLMHHPDENLILLGEIGFALIIGGFSGVIPVTITELFPRAVRVSAASVSYNFPYAIFGGTAPMVGAWLVDETANGMAVAWYLAAVAVFTFCVSLTLPETRGRTLD